MSTILCFLFFAIKSSGLKLLMNECSEYTTLHIVIGINLKFLC
jgi:hypothetical protein